ncbi:MAG: DUF4174 domain-containing protein [Cyclobacteriaceae bacterium]|nr:DUF4174 domain-containing protein [Cyclobacteriaceae bacterium]
MFNECELRITNLPFFICLQLAGTICSKGAVYFGNDLHQQQVDKQLSLFREKESACRERDLDVLHVYLLPERAKLYKRYNIPFGEYRVVLVGKDRGAKLISDDLVNPRQIFDLIDSMPMRQWEMQRKKEQKSF